MHVSEFLSLVNIIFHTILFLILYSLNTIKQCAFIHVTLKR